jgi:peptidoglycan/LPS O-acetylase OafA/YrhL
MRGAGERWRLGRRPALDGVRGLAILLVLICHVSVPGMNGAGAVGVAVFFTLSGFLITGLLLEEHDRARRVDMRAFYVRRVRRLLPALAVSTIVVVLAGLWLGEWWLEWRDVPPVVLYYGNWIEAGPGDLGALGVTWSLAIEEQFYLLWPLGLLWLAKRGRRTVTAVALVGCVLSLVVRIALIASGSGSDRVYYGSDTVALALLAGAALVSWRSGRTSGPSRPLMAVVGIALIMVVSTWSALAAAYVSLPVVAFASVLLIHGASGSGGLRILEARWLIWFGQRSYSLYLWHAPLAWGLRVHAGWSWPALVVVVVPVSLALAEASYRWVEQPWRSARGPVGLMAEVVVGRPVERETGGSLGCLDDEQRVRTSLQTP